MTYLYVAIKIITFPGAILRGFWEHLMCRIYGVPVEDARLLRPNEMCGHIEHELTTSHLKSFGISFFPFLFNLILGLLLVFPSAIQLFYFKNFTGAYLFVFGLLFWVGVSLLTNLFPSIETALLMWENIFHSGTQEPEVEEETARCVLDALLADNETIVAEEELLQENVDDEAEYEESNLEYDAEEIEDTLEIKNEEPDIVKPASMFSKIILAPFAAILYGGAYLDAWGLSLITSIIAGVGLPFFIALFIK